MTRHLPPRPTWKSTLGIPAFFAAVFICLWPGHPAQAGTAEEDWAAIIALDKGPSEHPQTADAAAAVALGHLAHQEKALRTFIAAHPADAHAFEAQLRLSRALQIRADFEHSEKLRLEALAILQGLDKTATPEQRPELEFAKITRQMRSLRRSDPTQCQALLDAARRFQSAYPTDHRVPSLLAEVATLYDNQPALKQALLEDALAVVKESDVKARIVDDLKRVRLFGQVVPLKFTSVQGKDLTIDSFSGHPLFVIFFGQFSTQSMAAVEKLQAALASFPPGAVSVVGISLDTNRQTVLDTLKSRHLNWPVAFDGKGWESPFARDYGINMVPTVWLLDAEGRLRSLNALDSADILARQLLREH
jgi:peroxiredoxin